MAPLCAAPGAGYTRAADSKGTARTNGAQIIAQSAISTFVAGLPEPRHGRIVTVSATIDSWKLKPRAILERLRLERRAGARP